MNKQVKLLKKFIDEYIVIIIIIVGIGLFYYLNNYNKKKSVTFENYRNNNFGFQGGSELSSASAPVKSNNKNSSSPNASNPLGFNETSMLVSGIKTNMGGIKPKDCNVEKMIDPSELLPKDNNKYFNNMNPNGNGDLKNMNLLSGVEKIGMSSQVLRNPNLQLRCEPPNPIKKVGPWMQTTIEPDLHRRSLDGNCKQ